MVWWICNAFRLPVPASSVVMENINKLLLFKFHLTNWFKWALFVLYIVHICHKFIYYMYYIVPKTAIPLFAVCNIFCLYLHNSIVSIYTTRRNRKCDVFSFQQICWKVYFSLCEYTFRNTVGTHTTPFCMVSVESIMPKWRFSVVCFQST